MKFQLKTTIVHRKTLLGLYIYSYRISRTHDVWFVYTMLRCCLALRFRGRDIIKCARARVMHLRSVCAIRLSVSSFGLRYVLAPRNRRYSRARDAYLRACRVRHGVNVSAKAINERHANMCAVGGLKWRRARL